MLSLFVFILICFVTQLVGSVFTYPEIAGWYANLAKPFWNPPSWVFGPVWSALYLLIAISGWMIWKERHKVNVRTALVAYTLQLLLNGIWSFLFFGMHSPLLGLIDISLLWAAILITIRQFRLIRPLAARLLIPYWVWVTFAACLNFAIWRLN